MRVLMFARSTLLALLGATFVFAGCSSNDDDGKQDSGVTDTGRQDTGTPDTGTPDTGTPDTGTPDTGMPDTGTPDGGVVDLRIPELTGPVTVDFDEYGVLHASCQTDLDCVAVEGYFHAAHRFGQMDLRRRFPKGEIAGVLPLGPGIEQSRFGKTIFGIRNGDRISDQMWENASEETKALLEAYTRGVNAWIADLRNGTNGARLTDDWAHLRDQVQDWEPQDSIACVLALIESLTNQSDYEITTGEVLASITATMAWDLYSLRPPSPSTILPAPGTLTALNQDRLRKIREVQGRLQMAKGALEQALRNIPKHAPGLGSNNWVLGPSRTADGKALLANDPHLGLDFPSVWYLAHLDAKTNGTGQLHVAGASFAGLPGIVLGQNEQIAWGATTTFFDLADVYIETLNTAGDAVIFNGNEVPILERTFPIDVLGSQPINHVVRYVPHHGPILAEDPQMGVALSLKWTAQDATTDANFLWAMNTAQSVAEARTALENVTTVGQNWVVIDTGGNFGWFPYNHVPNRPWASAALPTWVPLPGDGSAEWEGVVPYADLPQAMNTTDGFVATANNDMTGHLADGDPTNDGQAAWQHFVAPGYRHERIVQRIMDGANAHTHATMQSIQADTHVLIGERLVPAILAAAPAADTLTPEGALVLSALDAWDYECPTGLTTVDPSSAKDPDPSATASSIGCTAFHALFPRLQDAIFGDEIAQQGIDTPPRTSAIVFALTRPSELIGSYWDDVSTAGVETEADTIGRALDETGAYLTAHPRLGADADDWRWGRIHTVTLTPPIFPPSSGTYANDGGMFTIDVANPAGATDFRQFSGPSMRFSCDADDTDGVRCSIELPGGQRHFSDSPHFADLLQRWLVNDPIPVRFVASDVQSASVEHLTVQPAN